MKNDFDKLINEVSQLKDTFIKDRLAESVISKVISADSYDEQVEILAEYYANRFYSRTASYVDIRTDFLLEILDNITEHLLVDANIKDILADIIGYCIDNSLIVDYNISKVCNSYNRYTFR